uniref:Uncharacterized protein AlNc14C106G6216 n=1 Tax=Albugo laibachii Nc14 TaxID=890382 RepID=F0WI09_9STRA|nr:conserved hypothetical protein [Albugo laibachii Nc14]|eukprot:CCA20886.1 conserved hypothetical protein [Albugo laibachii Nc14]
MSNASTTYSNFMFSIAASTPSSPPNQTTFLNRPDAQPVSGPAHCILTNAPNEPYTVYTTAPSECETPHSTSQSKPRSCPLTSPNVKLIAPPKHSTLRSSKLHSNDASFKKKGTRRGTLNARAKNILKAWMFSPEHFIHPYPNEEEKEKLANETGIDMKQLSNWFTNARKRLWQPVLRQSGVEVKRFLSTGRGGPRGGNPSLDLPTQANTCPIPLQTPAHCDSSSIQDTTPNSDHSDEPVIDVSPPSITPNQSFSHVVTPHTENHISSFTHVQTANSDRATMTTLYVQTPNPDNRMEWSNSAPKLAWSPDSGINILNRKHKRPLTRPLAPISELISRNEMDLEPRNPQIHSLDLAECFSTHRSNTSQVRKNENCDRFQDLEVLAVCSLLRLNQPSIPVSHYCDRVCNE